MFSCGGAQSKSSSSHFRNGDRPDNETRQPTERELLLAEAESHWAKRDENRHVVKALEFWHRALALKSQDIETWNRISRAHLFLVESLCIHSDLDPNRKNNDGNDKNARNISNDPSNPTRIPVEPEATRRPLSTDLSECQSPIIGTAQKLPQSERLDLLEKGKQAAERALALLAPDILKQIEAPDASIVSLDSARTSVVPALYWRTIALDQSSRIKGYIERVFQKDTVMVSMMVCLDKNPRYDHAGPHRYLGSFYARPLSVADKDLKKSKMHFERAIAIAPDYLANRYRFARDYAVMAQDRKTFESQLRTVLETDIETNPSTAPENRMYRQKAERLLRLASEYFE